MRKRKKRTHVRLFRIVPAFLETEGYLIVCKSKIEGKDDFVSMFLNRFSLQRDNITNYSNNVCVFSSLYSPFFCLFAS